MILHSEWDFTASTVCTVTGVTANLAGTAPTLASHTSGRTLTITTIGAVTSSQAIDITCTYVLITNTTSTTTDLVASLVTYDSAAGN